MFDWSLLDKIVAVVATLATLSVIVERGLELVKPLFLKIKDENWQKSAKIAAATLVGFGLAAVLKYDALAQFGLSVPAWVGFLATGAAISGGSSVWHPILEWLKTIKE